MGTAKGVIDVCRGSCSVPAAERSSRIYARKRIYVHDTCIRTLHLIQRTMWKTFRDARREEGTPRDSFELSPFVIGPFTRISERTSRSVTRRVYVAIRFSVF